LGKRIRWRKIEASQREKVKMVMDTVTDPTKQDNTAQDVTTTSPAIKDTTAESPTVQMLVSIKDSAAPCS